MADTSTRGGSHGQFILMLDASGVDDRAVDTYAQDIHLGYMDEFGMVGAMTVSLCKLERLVSEGTMMDSPSPWTHVIRYFGPRTSVEWLRDRIAATFDRAGSKPRMQTFEISDMTGRYVSRAESPTPVEQSS